ncbi:hypothetical protein DMH03_13455 [Amycolatopsis sp. WAC 01376]|uniref:DUF2247 family protein n=1 Tax=Amycolatopsis sp. WAC 01376 TaxID=2203195 RepID=UPI000F77D9F3|nr:DUF2247 family protein [Amycolatopsis sp. WAC 01376]RSM63039.1 hypothetical protein DMH03_13455 [Amycolatopsis sp. WAC 01376]
MSDSDLVKFRIPASFVTDNVALTPAEAAYGFEHGWLTADDVVKVALAAYETFTAIPGAFEELALLLSDDYDRVPDLLSALPRREEKEEARVWFFLALSWVYDHKDSYVDPLETVEMISADFGYPEEGRALLRFTPVDDDRLVGVESMYERWLEYIQRTKAYLSKRAAGN